MEKEEFAEFRKQLALAFKDRAPNTECLEVVRLLARLPTAFRAEFGDEWREVANPERFFVKAKLAHDAEYLTSAAYMYLHVLLMTEIGFEPEAREFEITELAEDMAFEEGFSLRPNGMD